MNTIFENDSTILENDNAISENDNAISENDKAISENDTLFCKITLFWKTTTPFLHFFLLLFRLHIITGNRKINNINW